MSVSVIKSLTESVFSGKLWRSLFLVRLRSLIQIASTMIERTEKKSGLIIQDVIMDWKMKHLAYRNFYR